MYNIDGDYVNLAGNIRALIIVANFEVSVRCTQLRYREMVGFAAIKRHRKLIIGVIQLVREDGLLRNCSDLSEILMSPSCGCFKADSNNSFRVVV